MENPPAGGDAYLLAMPTQWDRAREQFPVLRHWTREAMERHHCRRDEQACLDFLDWFDDADRVRALAARLLGCQPDDVAFAPSTSTALGWLISGMRWQAGDRVAALAGEFPNNTYTGYGLARHGVEFVEVPLAAGEFSLGRFLDAIDRRTRLVLMSTVNYATGLRPPMAEIGRALRERGVLFYADLTQSLGALRTDLREMGADMAAAHGYKWLCAPPGVGLACLRPEVREWLQPSHFSWRSHTGWRQVDALHHGPPVLPASAQKYEGGLLNFAGVYALGAILEWMLALGPEAIEHRVQDLAEYGRAVLRACGARFDSDRLPYYDSPLLAARFDGVDVASLAARLRAARVVVSARHGALRVSPHFFNSESDLDRLAEAIRYCVK